MQPSSKQMQGLNSLLDPSQMSSLGHHHQEQQQIPNCQLHHHDHHHQVHQDFEQQSSTHDEFLEQMLSTLPSYSWPPDLTLQNPKSNSTWDPNPRIKGRDSPPSDTENLPFHHFNDSALLSAKLRQHQISGGNTPPSAAAVKSAMAMMLQQQMMMSRGVAAGNGMGRSPSSTGSGDSGLIPLPSLNGGDLVDQSQNDVVDASVQGMINGFTGSLHGSGHTSNQSQHFHHPQRGTMQEQNFGATGAVMNGAPANGSSGGGGGGGGGGRAQPRQRIRARRGQATDPHSIAERLRRERIAERMKSLQELVPNANKTDKASMLDEIIDYVKFLQLQVKVLSMSRLGGAAAVAPLVADMSSVGGGDCLPGNGGGMGRGNNGTQTTSTNDSLRVTEHQVAKLMEEDMGLAMQYLQGKGLCLMPISLATAISTSTCNSRSHLTSTATDNAILASNGEGPLSPSMSVLTVQSATTGNHGDNGVNDAASVSKP